MSELKPCQNPYCGNDGYYPEQVSEDEWEQVQCEFCYTEPNSVFNVVSALNTRIAELEKKIDIMTNALKIYADEYNWSRDDCGILSKFDIVEYEHPMNIAKRALEAK